VPRDEFLDRVRKLESETNAGLATGVAGRWRPGRGALASSALSAFKDAVVAQAVRRLGGVVPRDLAVIAVGGYGRGELAPFSDLDILILAGGSPDEAAFVSLFLHVLWDLGWRVASSVRSVRETVADARDDVQLLTSLLTARPVTGNGQAWERLRAGIAGVAARSRLRFLEERAAEARAALRDPGAEILVKEPNVKTGAGALRTIHLMQWLARAFAGEQGGLGALEPVLGPGGVRRIEGARDFFLFLRNYLHFSTGQREDVLRIGLQAGAADAFGIRGDEKVRATRLARRYHEKALDVALTLEAVVDDLTLRYLKPRPKRTALAGCFRAGGLFYVAEEAREARSTAAGALEALAECARSGTQPSASLLACLAAAARSLAVALRGAGGGGPRAAGGDRLDPALRELFVAVRAILSLPNAGAALDALALSGFLYVYFAPLGAVRHLTVHNSFHRFPVDRHSIEAVKALEAFAALATEDAARYATPARLCASYRDTLWVVKLALLLHDAGKAYAGDHAKNGAELARGWLRALPTESLFKDMIVFLVENHLLLSNLSRRDSVDDPSVAEHLAGEFIVTPFPEESLDFLFLTTCADVSATNPRAFSGYTAARLEALYQRTALLVRGPAQAEGGRPAAAVGDRLEELVRRLAEHGDELPPFATALGLRYCAANAPEEIQRDYLDFCALARGGGAGFRMRVVVFNDHIKVKAMAPDRIGLFSIFSGILLLSGADIVRADIHTHQGIAVDEFVVTGVHGYDILEQRMEKELSAWVDDLSRAFETWLPDPAGLDRVVADIERGMKAQLQGPPAAFRRETSIAITPTGGRGLRIELSCTDRPALLYEVTRRIAALGIDVRSAVIDTTGWNVRDRFDAAAREEPDPTLFRRLEDELWTAAERGRPAASP
jgi:[protein-PII] uridylyltransferase